MLLPLLTLSLYFPKDELNGFDVFPLQSLQLYFPGMFFKYGSDKTEYQGLQNVENIIDIDF